MTKMYVTLCDYILYLGGGFVCGGLPGEMVALGSFFIASML